MPSFSAKSAAGSRKTSVWICDAAGGSYSFGAFQNWALSVSTFSTMTSHFSFDSAAIHFLRVRAEADRVHAEGDESLRPRLLAPRARRAAAVHVVADVHPGVVAVDLGQPAVAEVVLLRRRLAPGGLQERDHELRVVRPVVHRGPRLLVERRGRVRLEVLLQGLLGGRRRLQVPGQDVEGPGGVGRALDVGVAAEGVDAAARPADVAEQELEHRGRADHLDARRVLRPAERVGDRADPLGVPRRSHDLADLEELVLRRPADPLDHVGRVAVHVLLQELEDAARVLERRVHLVGLRLGIRLVGPVASCRSPPWPRRNRRRGRR